MRVLRVRRWEPLPVRRSAPAADWPRATSSLAGRVGRSWPPSPRRVRGWGPVRPGPACGRRRGCGRAAPPAGPEPLELVIAAATITEVATREEATSRPKRLPVRVAAAAIARWKGRASAFTWSPRSAQGVPALGAEAHRVAVGGAAAGTEPGGVGALELEHPLDREQLGVDPLQLGRLAGQHVEAHVVADRHLVEGAAEVGLHDGELLQQTVALGDQLGALLRLRRLFRGGRLGGGLGPGPWRGLRGRSPQPLGRAAGQLAEATHGSAPLLGADVEPGSPPTTVTSGRFCWALM